MKFSNERIPVRKENAPKIAVDTKNAFHSPNVPSAKPGEERLVIRTLAEKNGTIEIE